MEIPDYISMDFVNKIIDEGKVTEFIASLIETDNNIIKDIHTKIQDKQEEIIREFNSNPPRKNYKQLETAMDYFNLELLKRASK